MKPFGLHVIQFSRALFFFTAIFFSAALHANTLLIWPVRIGFTAGQRTAELWLENRSADNVSLQIRVLEWKQSDGKDDYTPQQILLASPPFSSIPGNKKQLIRLVRIAPGDNTREQQFRVLIDEIPRKDDRDDSGVQFQMRYSVPVFFEDIAPPKNFVAYFAEKLSYRIADGHLQIVNSGDYSARIARLSTRDKNRQQQYLTEGLLGYVLPGSTMSWAFDKAISHGLFAEVNGQEVELQQRAAP